MKPKIQQMRVHAAMHVQLSNNPSRSYVLQDEQAHSHRLGAAAKFELWVTCLMTKGKLLLIYILVYQ